MHRCYITLCERGVYFDEVLFDGNQVCETSHASRALVKGDTYIPEIMAASILAKTARDDLMVKFSHYYPNWDFEKHKGYPTREHLRLCSVYGLSPIHRTTFRIKKPY